MKDWFFYQERGKTLGPLTGDDLRARIRDGRIRMFDLIYREGELGWKMALEHPDLSPEFKRPELASLNERPWVCLHRRSPESFEFITLGPYSEAELKVALQTGKVTYSDYIWQNGFLEWKRIGNLEEFNAHAKSSSKASDAPTVMVPISKTAIGSIHEEPAPKEVKTPPDVPPLPDIPDEAIELLKNVVDIKRAARGKDVDFDSDRTRIVAPSLPQAEEDFDPDKTRVVSARGVGPMPPLPVDQPPPRATFRPPLPNSKPDKDKDKFTDIDSDSEDEILVKRPRSKRQRARQRTTLWTDWLIVASLLMILVIAIGFLIQKLSGSDPEPLPPKVLELESSDHGASELAAPQDSSSLPALNPQPVQPIPEPIAPPEVPVVQTAPAVKPEPKPEPIPQMPAEPRQLVLKVQNSGVAQAKIEVRSDGGKDFPLDLEIIGLPGQVSEGIHYYRFYRLKQTGSLTRPLKLPQLKLPQGRFLVRAESGALAKEAELRLGMGETSYRQATARNRKMYSAAVWTERLKLYKSIQIMESAVDRALKSKRLSSKGLEILSLVKKSNGSNFIFVNEWLELKEIFSQAKIHATKAHLERLKRLSNQIEIYSLWRGK